MLELSRLATVTEKSTGRPVPLLMRESTTSPVRGHTTLSLTVVEGGRPGPRRLVPLALDPPEAAGLLPGMTETVASEQSKAVEDGVAWGRTCCSTPTAEAVEKDRSSSVGRRRRRAGPRRGGGGGSAPLRC